MNTEFENTPCLVCGADEYETYSRKGQFGLPTHVVICRRCGFSYLNPRWTKSRYDHFYRVEYDRYYRPEVITQNDENYRYKPVQKILSRFEERGLQKKFGNVLDIGSGMGHALIYLKKNVNPDGAYNAIEPSEHCKTFLLQNGIGYLDNDVYGDWDAPGKKYDLIIMRHVLEHFHDPLTVLQKAQHILSDDGLLYVAVPDAFHPTRPLRSHFFRIVHISYFSKISLNALLQKAGLKAEYMVEGDAHERNEIFAICRKAAPVEVNPDPSQFSIQKKTYDETGKNDLYYELKGKLISVLRKLHLLK